MSGFDLFDWLQRNFGNKRRSAGGAGAGNRAPGGPAGPPPTPGERYRASAGKRWLVFGLIAVLVYAIYFWEFRRIVVPPDHVLVVMKKWGTKSLPGDQIIIPRAPDRAKDPAGYDKWEQQWKDYNGIYEHVYSEGVYFGFGPFDYERYILPVKAPSSRHDSGGGAIIPNGMVGVVVKKFGKALPPGQVLAEAAKDERGPLPILLYPGRYNEYANPFAYEIKHFRPVEIQPGEEGIVTLMAAQPPKDPNQYLVADGEQGTQPRLEPPGFRYVNLYEKRIIPINVRSHKFEMSGAEGISFPSSDSFEIRMQGFVEWRVVPEMLPLIYVQYGEGGRLESLLDEKVILPYARSFCRLVGSQYSARDFITGDTKLKFQQEFETKLRDACRKQGIEIRQALVRDIEPPQAIKEPINEREIAREQIKQYEQQILVAKTQSELTTQEMMAEQNKAIGDANRQVVTITKKAEQERDVAVTRANQELAVAKLKLEAAQKESEALLQRGQADAAVILLDKEAEAKPLAEQVHAFGDGTAYAQYFFNQKIAGSVKSILSNTDGPFGEIFRQFMPATAPGSPGGSTAPKVTSK